jgi:mRNA-degrading endonuclease RelE of RelBE toxin-antitoxin system
MAFAIELSPHARLHVRQLRKREQPIILDAITLHLTHQPDLPAQNRKMLQDNPLAPWELRVGDYRVFYDVSPESGTVIITPARKFRMLLHTNPTRERGEYLGTRAGASEDM